MEYIGIQKKNGGVVEALQMCIRDSSFFAKVSLAFSCTLPKSAYSQNFLLTRLDFCGNLSQQLLSLIHI